MILNEEQKAILNGEKGENLAKVLESVIRYGELFGAEKLVPVTSKHNHLVTSFGLKAMGPVYDLMDKLIKAAKHTGIKQITIGGGVSANSGLRARIEEEGRKRGWTTFLPEFKFTTDNAAMIAIAGWFHFQNGERASLDVAPVSRLAEF